MTESRIENLLQQMSVKTPSSELDRRVENCLNETLVIASSESSRRRSWSLLSTVAVSCLVIGLIAGHLVADATSLLMPQTEVTFESPDEVVDMVRVVPTELVATNYKDLLSKLRGPSVTMLCAMKTEFPESATQSKQCLTCHDGMIAAKAGFREHHITNPGFATCMWCHNTKELTTIERAR
jgi:hypothetical protein